MHRSKTQHKLRHGLVSGACEPSKTVWRSLGCTHMHIVLRGRAEDFIRFSKGLQTSLPSSPPGTMGDLPIVQAALRQTFSQGITPPYWRGTTGTFILDLSPILLTGHQATLVSSSQIEESSPRAQYLEWPTDNQQGAPGSWGRRGFVSWVGVSPAGSLLHSGLCNTISLASIRMELKPGNGSQHFIQDPLSVGMGEGTERSCALH